MEYVLGVAVVVVAIVITSITGAEIKAVTDVLSNIR